MSLQRDWIGSPNVSSRGGARVTHIVVHTAEGALTYQSLGNYFASSSAQVSSHTGIDDTPGVVGEYVARNDKAWTASNANPWSVQAELCAFADWSTDEWMTHPTMLENTAAWIAEEAAAFGIPILSNAGDAQNSGSEGVCQHNDLGSMGGGHWDCGPGFPIDHVLALAGGQPAPAPSPPKPGGPAPAFPYQDTDYLGQPSNDPHCHSGFYGGVDQQNVQTWQAQMSGRGWMITVDGMYGPQSSSVARNFQQEKGLGVDGLVGPQTWGASWTEPIT
jgi:peptidoglycan hydrolase-like protein with peptidoglycan-binding domain